MQKFLFEKTANYAKEWLQKKICCLLFQKYYEKEILSYYQWKNKCKTIGQRMSLCSLT